MHENERQHLAKLIGMIGSAHDGEIASAARAAERYRLSLPSKPSWSQIIAGDPAVARERDQYKTAFYRCLADLQQLQRTMMATPTSGPMGEYIARHRHILSEWEIGFLQSIGVRASLSWKQEKVITRIEGRTGCRVPRYH